MLFLNLTSFYPHQFHYDDTILSCRMWKGYYESLKLKDITKERLNKYLKSTATEGTIFMREIDFNE